MYTDGIVSYMKKQSAPSSVEVTSAEELKNKLEKSTEHCIVGNKRVFFYR